ncbi:RICIN domain-containing protein [Streptomyces melanogenes]|uniref:RICIN domain-containing protein n=1 Tax=Streptomyces melanogenes TaxID=67326 RepID=UPI00167EA334|nr:RICIN domain-containing protein [Streptomyces melanogenes]GGP82641.1 hypothetical protein GCM10010278_71630 [Streptomyces melanogenes]
MALAVGAAVLTLGAVPAAAVAAHADGTAGRAAAVSCNKNHAYRYGTPGGPGAYVYLNVAGGSHKGAKVITYPWSGGKGNERWCLERGRDGYGWYFHPWDNRSLCLDVPGGRYKKGQGLIVWSCNKRKNQLFDTTIVHTDNPYTLITPWYSNLKVHRGKDAFGSQVSLWPHLNTHAEWR